MILTKKAYGKINLYLDVLDKKADGYHNIKSIMQGVSLADTISLEISDVDGENEIDIIASNARLKCDKSNLIYKAWLKFFQATEIKGKRCVFTLEKQIPMAAGMAGGSSDAACTLLLLNEAFGYVLKENELDLIGASIGADVAFCLKGGTCICEGIGEKITPINRLENVLLVCAIDSSSVSTPVAFSLLDEKFGTSCTDSSNFNKVICAVNKGDLSDICESLYNKFEEVIIPQYDAIDKIKKIMLNNGALGALMSGSGPSVFGIFDSEDLQKNAFDALKNDGINAFLCKTI